MIGVLLAGGQASRIGGGDKGARLVGGVPIIDRVITVMRGQCDALVISANGDLTRFDAYGLPCVADAVPDQPGPLAGVLAGLDHVAAHHPEARFVVTVPVDTPFLPADLVARLQDRRLADNAAIVCARSAGRGHYAIATWAVELRHDLRQTLQEGRHKVRAFVEQHAFAYADWPVHPVDPFFNVNTLEDLEEANRLRSEFGASSNHGSASGS